MLLKITDAEYLHDHKVRLSFNDGRDGVADLRALIDSKPLSLFSVFADETFVKQFGLEHGTLCWPGERDVAAEYLYFLAFRDDPALQSLFEQWGYLDEPASALTA